MTATANSLSSADIQKGDVITMTIGDKSDTGYVTKKVGNGFFCVGPDFKERYIDPAKMQVTNAIHLNGGNPANSARELQEMAENMGQSSKFNPQAVPGMTDEQVLCVAVKLGLPGTENMQVENNGTFLPSKLVIPQDDKENVKGILDGIRNNPLLQAVISGQPRPNVAPLDLGATEPATAKISGPTQKTGQKFTI